MYDVINGNSCFDCGCRRCNCPELEREAAAEARQVHRTARLMSALELAEAKLEALTDIAEFHPDIPETKERINNLSRALLNHRRALKGF